MLRNTIWVGLLTIAFLAPSFAADKKDTPQANKALPPSVRITRSPDTASLVPSDRQFVVECRIVGGTHAKTGVQEITFSLPEITVRDGEKVTLEDTTTESQTVAYKTEAGRRLPITRQTKTGSIFDITVIASDDDHVVLDATVMFLGSPFSDNEQGAANKRFLGTRAQIVDCIKLGEKATARLTESGGTVEIVVSPLTQTVAASSARSF